jgi:hypothetical protein
VIISLSPQPRNPVARPGRGCCNRVASGKVIVYRLDANTGKLTPNDQPQPLLEQLKSGGKMVIPVGESGENQTLRVITKGADSKREERDLLPVRFVPLRRAEKADRK